MTTKVEKTFTFAGVSTLNGKVKARFANDAGRVKVLTKNGHTSIDLIDLASPMTKLEAVEHLLKIDFHSDLPEVQAALLEAKTSREVKPEAPKTEAAPAATAESTESTEAVAEAAQTEAVAEVAA